MYNVTTSRAEAYTILARIAEDLRNEIEYSDTLKKEFVELKEKFNSLKERNAKGLDEIITLKESNKNLYAEKMRYESAWLELLEKYEHDKYEKYMNGDTNE